MGEQFAKGERSYPGQQRQETTLMDILLDTTVLIDALRNRKERRALLAECVRAGHSLMTTGLNIAEVYSGMCPQEEVATSVFLDQLGCYDTTAEIGRLGGMLKNQWAIRGRTLSLIDAIIAATAITHRCTLMTDNDRDFPMPELSKFSMPK
jgi:predicted nucleic acid-binding protein